MWILAFIVPLAVDAFSCVLGIRRGLKGSGASGIPMLTVPLYGIGGYAVSDGDILATVLILLAGAAVHAALVFVIPMRVASRRAAP